MVRRLLLLAIIGLLAFACYPSQGFDLGHPTELEFRETKTGEDEALRIRFDRVISDERCPVEHYCLLPGNAEVELTFWNGSRKESFVLNTSEEPRAIVSFGYTIQLTGLTPPRSLTSPPHHWDYKATVVITSAGDDCLVNADCADENAYCRKKDGHCDTIGQCEIKPEICPANVDPVCGCDGRTYNNACSAATFGVNIAYKGTCQENPRDDSCDDGTVPLCDMVAPECSEYEILAYRNDCYVCVNPATCLPWGEPNCETDDDCGPDHYCEPCGTSSCPFCEDCVAACVPK